MVVEAVAPRETEIPVAVAVLPDASKLTMVDGKRLVVGKSPVVEAVKPTEPVTRSLVVAAVTRPATADVPNTLAAVPAEFRVSVSTPATVKLEPDVRLLIKTVAESAEPVTSLKVTV